MDQQEWPDFDQSNKFDWSLSLSQIEKKYGLPNISNSRGQKSIRPMDDLVEESKSSTSDTELFLKKFRKKYEYAFDLIEKMNPDMPRWIFENLIAKPFFVSGQLNQ